MSRNASSSGFFGDHNSRARGCGAGAISSNSSPSRAWLPCPARDRRSILSRDYTDRGRDLDGNHHSSFYNRRSFNPQGGGYAWSSDSNSDDFYRPTRIPLDSFNFRRHSRRYADSDTSDRSRRNIYNYILRPAGYHTDRQLDYSWQQRGYETRPSSVDRLTDSIREGRHEDIRRDMSRSFQRSHYSGRRANDADYEDNESGLPEGLRQRREGARAERASGGWRRGWQHMTPDARSGFMERGLNDLQSDYMNRRRGRAHSVDEGPRERWRTR